jgi:glycosyltransferase involved in cell wall biosynthesis
MRIAILHDSLARMGGAENFIISYTSKLINKGYSIDLITKDYNGKLWDAKITKKLSIIKNENLKFNRNPFMYEYYGYKVIKSLKKYDLIIVHLWLNSSLYASYKKKNIPWVWYCQEPPRYIHYNIMDKELFSYWNNRQYFNNPRLNSFFSPIVRAMFPIFRKLDKNYVRRVFSNILTNSQFTSDNVKLIYGRNSIPCLPGIRQDFLKKSYEDKKLIHNCDFLMLHVGRLSPPKNIIRIILALKKLDVNYSFKLIIIGINFLSS